MDVRAVEASELAWPPAPIEEQTHRCESCGAPASCIGDNVWACQKCDKKFHASVQVNK